MLFKFPRSSFVRILLIAAACLALTMFGEATRVFAGGVVGNGTPASCTEAALTTALAGGGSVTFNCGATAQMILLASAKSIAATTTIDGGNKITLSGGNSTQLFVVNGGVTLTLQNIILSNGYNSGDGGAIYNGGTLNLKHTTIQNSNAVQSGGAIVTYGKLAIDDSTLAFNKGANGGAVYPRYAPAQVSITNSVLHDNQAIDTANGWGGAILLWDGAAVAINNTDLYNNSARQGGAVWNAFSNSSMSFQGSKVRNNKATNGNGGGIYSEQGSLTMNNVTVSGNTAENIGGGVEYYNGSSATLAKVTFSDNSGAYAGGMGIESASGVSVVDSTFSGNSAIIGGAIDNTKSTSTLTNVTIASNSATSNGGGISSTSLSHNGTGIVLKNTIVANSLAGGNCYDYYASSSQGLFSSGFNLSSDNTCTQFFSKAGDLNNVTNPKLNGLANNSGFTETILPQADSPVIDAGTDNGCPATDQRDVQRPQGLACDIGSVEVVPAPVCPDKPDKPTLLTPANNTKTKGLAVTLDWNDTHCAQSYQVIVKLGSTTGSKAFKKKNLTASTVTTSPLTKGQTYYWQVTAIDPHGKTKSDWFKFKVK